jgi:hypothetical protein
MSNSILSNERECYVCKTPLNLHKHHIFPAANRKNSEKYGCWVYLCAWHHNMSNEGVHFNRLLDVELRQTAQRKFEELHSHEEFMRIFGKNWL